MSKKRAANPPRGECRQCWAHAEDPDAHKHLPYLGGQCDACVSCAANNHAGKIVR
jgi:hypothetical protein